MNLFGVKEVVGCAIVVEQVFSNNQSAPVLLYDLVESLGKNLVVELLLTCEFATNHALNDVTAADCDPVVASLGGNTKRLLNHEVDPSFTHGSTFAGKVRLASGLVPVTLNLFDEQETLTLRRNPIGGSHVSDDVCIGEVVTEKLPPLGGIGSGSCINLVQLAIYFYIDFIDKVERRFGLNA
jgi:hypothetical protein